MLLTWPARGEALGSEGDCRHTGATQRLGPSKRRWTFDLSFATSKVDREPSFFYGWGGDGRPASPVAFDRALCRPKRASRQKVFEMIMASIAVAVLGLGTLLASVSGLEVPIVLPLASFALAAVLYLARDVSIYAKLLIGLVAGVHVVLALMSILAVAGEFPQALVGEAPALAMPIAATVFAAVLLTVSRIP